MPFAQRTMAAEALGKIRDRDAVLPLTEALAEGDPLSNACRWALLQIGSRRGARRLIQIAQGAYPLAARQEAVYTLWRIRELRAEPLFLTLCRDVDTEEEYTRSMATEALGNTSHRHRTQLALAERLFDPSPSVRYSAMCALPWKLPDFLRQALTAKLEDPDRVDDNRVIATFASEILAGRA
jgi:HEAT repeat protein